MTPACAPGKAPAKHQYSTHMYKLAPGALLLF